MNKCLYCNKETKNKKFCCQSHSAIFNNLNSGRKRKLTTCLFCGKEIDKNGYISPSRKFCCSQHCADYKSSEYIKKWLAGEESGCMKSDSQNLSHHVRNYLLKQANYQCSKCGWGEKNLYSKTIPLEIDHIDGDSSNNKPENLQVLCPNCHSLTPFYGILNKGRGRRTYKELYYKYKK